MLALLMSCVGCVKGTFIGTSVTTAMSDDWGVIYFMTKKGDTLPIELHRDITYDHGTTWRLSDGTQKIGDTIREAGGQYVIDSMSCLVRR